MKPRVVIIGGGFGGLYAAKKLRKSPVEVTLIDRRNFHLFQPLLYQVATGGLSPGDITFPIRGVFKNNKRFTIETGNVLDVDPEAKQVIFKDRKIAYDYLIVAAGARYHYFGNPAWEDIAPGLKNIENAVNYRSRILAAYEQAEIEPDLEKRKQLLTFVIIGGGPTGVEMAGAVAELAKQTLKHEFNHIDPAESRILLLEGAHSILATYPRSLRLQALKSLEKLGVEVVHHAMATGIDEQGVSVKKTDSDDNIRYDCQTIFWAAGIRSVNLADVLAERLDAATDKTSRIKVGNDCSVPGHSNIFVIGDMAHQIGPDGEPLPGVATVAMQQGEYCARLISRKIVDKPVKPFRFKNKGDLAVIGRNAAVANIHGLRLAGYPAWLIWAFVHLYYLIGYENRVLVFIQWAIFYFTRHRGARMITNTIGMQALEKEITEYQHNKNPVPVD